GTPRTAGSDGGTSRMVQKRRGARPGGRPPLGGYTTAAQRKSASRSTLYASQQWWEYLSAEQRRRRRADLPYDFSSIVIDGLKLLKRDGVGICPPAPADGWSSAAAKPRRVGVFLPPQWTEFVDRETERHNMDQTSLFVAG